MKNWVLGLSVLLNLVLLGVLVFLNDRYGLWAKVQRVILEEGRVPVVAASYELNRNYQVRREMFRLDKNKSVRVLMLGDSLTAQGEWNAMLGEPLVANRGIDGDTAAGVLARIGDDADFRGDTVVIWIGTNDVLQGQDAGPVAERIMEAARGKAAKLKKGLTTEHTEGTEEEAGPGLDKPSGAAFSNLSTSKLARDSENTSLIRSADGPASARIAPEGMGSGGGNQLADSGEFLEDQSQAGLLMDSQKHPIPRAAAGSDTSGKNSSSVPIREIRGQNSGPLDSGRSTLDTVPEAPKIFVLGVAPMARWWEGARERNAVIREINARLGEGAAENGYRFVELESVLADANGFLRGEMTSDGVHLNAKGYVAVIQRLKEAGLWPMAED